MMTTKMMLPVLLAGLLAACGGGGGGTDTAATVTPPASGTADTAVVPAPASLNTGSVSAAFVAGTSPRYMLFRPGSQQFGALSAKVQDATGAMTTINTAVLSGTTGVKEIAGDTSFAPGRWAQGTATTASGAEVLSASGSVAYHYVAFNQAASFPASGTLTCDAGNFTAPSYVAGGGASPAAIGTASGSASVAFGATGATVSGMLNNAAGGSTGSVSFSTLLASPSNIGFSGAFLSNGAGAGVSLGVDGAGYLVVAGYSTTLANGARYLGVATFRCK